MTGLIYDGTVESSNEAPPMRHRLLLGLCVVCAILTVGPTVRGASDSPKPLNVLMLGDDGHHNPAERLTDLAPYLLARGIHLVYTENVDALNDENLARYDALLLYANIDSISDAQADALLKYVSRGGGFVPVHCASYCFRNRQDVVALMGGQFQKHGTGVFTTEIVAPDHPVMRGHESFESWDETYIHHKHNPESRTVLSKRDGEPYTWTRTHGKGRVFYTAWGHDQRTWQNDGFRELIERGIRWAAGDDTPAETIAKRPVLEPFEYVKTDQVPYYPPGGDRSGTGDWPRMPKPLSPAESVQRMITPAGFEVKLFAAEPDIHKPICIAWDERGRLWVAETMDYPNDVRPEGQGRDRITICEDTDGDGRADKFTVFADKLNIPTSIAFAHGGVVVLQAPKTLFLKDTDGDDKADVRRVLFEGWSNNDTHAGPSNLHYGLDNHLWGILGYAGFNGEVGGASHRFNMAFWRMTPDATKLEVMRHTNNNSWGVGFTEDGLVFGSTANNHPSVYMPIAERYYKAVNGLKPSVLNRISPSARFLPITDRVRQVDVHGGYTAAAGHAVYTARTWPREYWNRRAFVTGPTGHLIGTFDLVRHGSDVKSINHENLLASDDEWTAPVMAEVGPDGHVWFIDWYNYIVQHNPTPKGRQTGQGNAYINRLRDKRHGRVYRIVWQDAEPYQPIDLTDATPNQLVATLAHDNLLWRRHAQRLLVERGKADVASGLITLIEDQHVDAVGLNVGAIHALWTLHGLNLLDGSNSRALGAAYAALRHPSAGVRRNALKVLPATDASTHAILAAGVLNDDDAQVRLAALLALSRMPGSKVAGASVFGMLAEPRNAEDRWIPEAGAAAGVQHAEGFLAAAGAIGGDESQAAKPVGENLLANSSFEQVADDQPDGWDVRHYRGQAGHAVDDDVARTGRRSLRITSKSGADSSWFTSAVVKPNTSYRLSGWIKTTKLNVSGNAHGALLNVHELQSVPGNRTAPVKGTSDWRRIETTFTTDNRTSITINALFGGWGEAIGVAWYDDLELVEMPPGRSDQLKQVIDWVQSSTDGSQATDVAADDQTLATGGDPIKGKEIFWHNEVAGCFRCHKVGDRGGIVGPELTGIAARQDAACLVQSLLDPNATIAESYPAQVSPMPPMRLLLSDEQIRDLVAYLRTLK